MHMKIFWSIFVTLLLACGAYLAFGRGGGAKPLIDAEPAPEIAPPMNYGVPRDESAFFEDDMPAGTPDVPAKSGEGKPKAGPPSSGTTEPSKKPVVDSPAKPAETPKPADGDSEKPGIDGTKKNGDGSTTDTKPGIEVNPDYEEVPASFKPDTPKPKDVKKDGSGVVAPPNTTPSTNTPNAAPTGGTPSAPSGAGSTPANGSTPEAAGDAKTEAADYTLVKQDDGSMLIDSKYTVRGEGTKESPYQITWEYLTSAEEVYQPRLGKKKLPGRLTMLNDHYVKISGYIAFPIMASEPTEMLTMLNQWDGCCIGVPPSPYDAIEVKLKKAAEGEERLASYGAVSGKMKVEPYLVKNWLVSLYMMEEGEITKK